jgi:membrane protease YdiL (CAAX protease family)
MRTDLPRRYLLFPFLSVLATSLTLAGLRAAGLPPERAALALGIRDPALLRVLLYALWAAATAWALVRILRREGIGLADLGWRGRLSPDAIGLAVLGAWAAAMIWLPFDALRQALGIPLYWDPAQRGFIQPASIPEFATAALAGLILVPPAEETMFRGYVLRPWKDASAVSGRCSCITFSSPFITAPLGPASSSISSSGPSSPPCSICVIAPFIRLC